MISVENPTGKQQTAIHLFLGIGLLLVLALAANYLTHHAGAMFGKDFAKALEYPIWAVVLGLLANIAMTLTKQKSNIRPAIRTELFLKIGLVLLGASVNMSAIISIGSRGIIQALILITSVFFFTWWLGKKFHLPDTLRAVMSTAISVCGVSAAIAAAGSVLAKKEELAYVTALVIFVALPLMVLMPWMASSMGLSPSVAGAWFGGNIDTTAAVVGAGTIYGEAAAKIAAVIKMTQNALIGIIAFALAVYSTTKMENGTKPSAAMIWQRFPKFILGFLLTSIIASLGYFAKTDLASIKNLQQWAFTLAFICIGLELSFSDLKGLGGKPTAVFLIATIFNTLLALVISFFLFG